MSLVYAQLWDFGWPILVLVAGAFLGLMLSVVSSRWGFRILGLLAVATLALSAGGFYNLWQQGTKQSMAFLTLDSLGNFLGLVLCLIGLITVILSYRYWEDQPEAVPEVMPLILFGVLGLVLMVATTHLLTFVLGLEILSLSLYVMVGTRRLDPKASEASFKYFLLGSVAAAFLLFGISLLYGSTGVLDIQAMAQIRIPPDRGLIFHAGALLLLLGFAFKIAAVPLHFWAPDVYDGAPVPVTGFMATAVKVAAFGALIRVIQALVGWEVLNLQKIFIGLSLATMVVGNLTALRQNSLKRIMAYSSIAHAGYILLGFAAWIQGDHLRPEGLSPILFYLVAYGLLTLGVFAILTALSRGGREIATLEDLKGLAARHPAWAACLSVFLISLAGIPPSAGFFAKYFLFGQAIAVGLYPLAIVGILTSAISLYYYLAPVVRMYFNEAESPREVPPMGIGVKVLVALLLVGVFYLGILPGKTVEQTRRTVSLLVAPGDSRK